MKQSYILEGLTCAQCASVIQERVENIQGIGTVEFNFVTQELVIDSSQDQTGRISAIVKNLEPHVQVVPKSDERKESSKPVILPFLIRIISSLLLGGLALFLFNDALVKTVFMVLAYAIAGYDVVFRAFRNIFKGNLFDENFLMTLATLGAFGMGEFSEAVAVMLFYQVGEFFQAIAVNKSRRSIKALLAMKPTIANVEREGEILAVAPEDIQVGEVITVRPGEKIPLDGIIVDGASSIDSSAVTGESVPVQAEPGDDVISGTVNLNGVIRVRVKSVYAESTVAQILTLVATAGNRKSGTEKFITRFARVYTPIVVAAAVLIGLVVPLVIPGQLISDWLPKALVFLVISCPCALVVSVPLSIFGGIGAASRQGILIKGGNYLEALSRVKTVVFDKTGTLTEGRFKATDTVLLNGTGREQFANIAVALESSSNHPIAVGVVKSLKQDNGRTGSAFTSAEQIQEIPGQGVTGTIDGIFYMAGNQRLLEQQGISVPKADHTGTIVYVADQERCLGYIVVADQVKNDSVQALETLRSLGVNHQVMLTGDRKETAEAVGKKLNIDQIHSELLPQDKVAHFERISAETEHTTLFAGDGINDAPVIARADVGVAMGGAGSDAAIEAADVVIMTDQVSRIAEGVKIARHTKRITMQNIIFSIGIKVLVMALGTMGFVSLWLAVFADVGVTFLAILNSFRTLIKKHHQ